MKPAILFFGLFSLLAGNACNSAQAPNQSNPDYQAPTVAPEIGEPVPVSGNIVPGGDSTEVQATDSTANAAAQDTLNTQKPTLAEKAAAGSSKAAREVGSAVKEAAQTIKKESEKVAQEVKAAAKDAAQTMKQEAGKAATAIKKTAKDTQERIKK